MGVKAVLAAAGGHGSRDAVARAKILAKLQDKVWRFPGGDIGRPGAKERTPGRRPGRAQSVQQALQTIKNLIGPEPLEPVQCLAERGELVGRDAARLLDGPPVPL